MERASEFLECLFWKFSVTNFRHNEMRTSVNSFSQLCPFVSFRVTGLSLRHSRFPSPRQCPLFNQSHFIPCLVAIRIFYGPQFPSRVPVYSLTAPSHGIPLPIPLRHSSTFCLLFCHEDGGITFYRNVCNRLSDCTM